jgi:small GTP-binding protein
MVVLEDYVFKVCIFGDGGVGKSTLVHRYLTGNFTDALKMTIGVEFHIKKLELEKNRITLQLWDFAGEERFRMLFPTYIRGASGGIFMYDVTRFSSLKNMKEWISLIRKNLRVIPLIMIGGKSDLHEERSVESEFAKELAEEFDFEGYGECSSKTGENIEEMFELLTRIIIEKHDFF